MRADCYPAIRAAWHRANMRLRCVRDAASSPAPRRCSPPASAPRPRRSDERRARRSSSRSSARSRTRTTSASRAPGGTHQGNDLLADKRAPVVAVEPGTIEVLDDVGERRLHALPLRRQRNDVRVHPPEQRSDGRATTTRASASQGVAYAPSRDGARVDAGQVIGYLGDSGRRERHPPAPAFRGAPEGGKAVDPYPYHQEGAAPARRRTARGLGVHAAADRHGRRRRQQPTLTADGRHRSRRGRRT